MIQGSCLCGGVRFEVERLVGPFELCHCGRCRRVSSGPCLAAVGVRSDEFHWLSGRELITRFAMPVREAPPAYSTCFCSVCGTLTPAAELPQGWFEIPLGMLDGAAGMRPDRHIFTDYAPAWSRGLDALPGCTRAELVALRAAQPPADDPVGPRR